MPPAFKLAHYGVGSTVLALYVVLLSFDQRSNFYSAAVYLSKSNACMLVRRSFRLGFPGHTS